MRVSLFQSLKTTMMLLDTTARDALFPLFFPTGMREVQCSGRKKE